MVNTALYPVGSFAITTGLLLLDFDTKKKHETKWKSIFIKITLNCSCLLFSHMLLSTCSSRGNNLSMSIPWSFSRCSLWEILWQFLCIGKDNLEQLNTSSKEICGWVIEVYKSIKNSYSINRFMRLTVQFSPQVKGNGLGLCYAIKRFMPLTNMQLTDFVCNTLS